MASHSIAPIPCVAAYFGDPEARPIVAQEYRAGVGWVMSPWRKRISRSYARTLRREGVTSVALQSERTAWQGRFADFTIAELLKG